MTLSIHKRQETVDKCTGVTLILFTSFRSAIFPESCSYMQMVIYTSEHRWHSACLFLNIKIKYIITKRGCRCTLSSPYQKEIPKCYQGNLFTALFLWFIQQHRFPVYIFTHVPRHPQLTYGNALTELMLVSWPGCKGPFSDICTTPSDWRQRPGAPFTVMGGSGRSKEEVKIHQSTTAHGGGWERKKKQKDQQLYTL